MNRVDPTRNNMSLIQKLQLIVDSCVGVLKREDFLNLETDLTNEALSDLTRFFYQSFPTIANEHNEMQPLDTYLFRSSTYSLFGHIIVNTQLFAKEPKSTSASVLQLRSPFLLNVITGTPGMGKSASRYPFITLLMSSGVSNVTTEKRGEGAFVFTQISKTNTGTVKIKTNVDGIPIEFDTPSYLYTYEVRYFNPHERSNDKKTEIQYYPAAYQVDPDPAKRPPNSSLGRISVPSVEYFPYFVRLMMGTRQLTEPRSLNRDRIITQTSELKRGSVIAEGSILYQANLIIANGFYKVRNRMTLMKGSTLGDASLLCLDSTDSPESTRLVMDNEVTDFDQIVEAGTIFEEGSCVTLKEIIELPLNNTEPIPEDIIIEAGSIIKKGSKIAPQSTVNYCSIWNRLKNTKWHVIDEFVPFLLIFSAYKLLIIMIWTQTISMFSLAHPRVRDGGHSTVRNKVDVALSSSTSFRSTLLRRKPPSSIQSGLLQRSASMTEKTFNVELNSSRSSHALCWIHISAPKHLHASQKTRKR
ncbi:hypothetical protein BLNAU_22355 [Blattamonas nauphoetae]|uniref:Uncharacterized protein n=1 Tax=Blattamonas nauphoetae TaxID=2049346 RepID=A0ABQ9WTB2_9EUKA|nr:hypothetical protein BLNAU_22355 [Blattamonas nauphoetae]